jgi:hypothetical protein
MTEDEKVRYMEKEMPWMIPGSTQKDLVFWYDFYKKDFTM